MKVMLGQPAATLKWRADDVRQMLLMNRMGGLNQLLLALF